LVHDVLVRPLWSAGIIVAPFVPVAWHERQSTKLPVIACGTSEMVLVGVAVGVGDGVGVVVPPVHEARCLACQNGNVY
jgi:hypothetical protein